MAAVLRDFRSKHDVDYMLEAWARWGKAALPGWPPKTLLARVIECGFTGAAQSQPIPEMDEAVQAVERAVLRLTEIERRVITKYYIAWEPGEVSARECGVGFDSYRQILKRARGRVADYIEGLRDHIATAM